MSPPPPSYKVHPPESSNYVLVGRSDPESPESRSTAAIIGVCSGVGSLLILFVAYRIWRCARSPRVPLPPKKPLAYDTQRQLASNYHESTFLAPRAPFTNHIPYQSLSESGSVTDVSSAPPPSPSMVSSQAHLIQSPTESEESMERVRGRAPSLGSSASTIRHQQRHRSRTASNAGSIHSVRSYQSNAGTVRGPPHRTRINIVLPQPLASGVQQYDPPVRHMRQSSAPIPKAPSLDTFSEPRGALYVPEKMYPNTSPDQFPVPYAITTAVGGRRSSSRTRRAMTSPSMPPVPPLNPSNQVAVTPQKRSHTPSQIPSTSNYSPDYGPPPLPPPKDPIPILQKSKKPQ